MLGAGLIKLRGDPCWRDLTCLVWHYETQPVPNPLSWWLNAQPRWFHVAGTAFNHVVELGAPFLLLAGARAARAAGLLFVVFQLTLIASGNLSFLNWLTIVPAIACFDDDCLRPLAPRRVAHGSREPAAVALAPRGRERGDGARRRAERRPVVNLLSPRQAMNRSFDRLHLVNTYGAFGSVGRERDEVILEGTSDPHPGPTRSGARTSSRASPAIPRGVRA
jgi:hypothetical protein